MRGSGVSETDSFIEEVSEEVRRDRLYGYLRRYGWIAVLAVLLIVGGAAFNEWRKAQARATAEATGDAILAALEAEAPEARRAALAEIDPEAPGARAVVTLLSAAEAAQSGEAAAAADQLDGLAADGDVEQVYRDLAAFKALLYRAETADPATRRLGFEALAQPGNPLRVLAEEQMALLDVADGDTAGAIDRLERIRADAEATPGLRRRAAQLIVALGGVPAPLADG